ncbi:uncharacterized protein STAUR_6320 [Stigmatella aurantiaca DW4/3-1]|uniref:Uncharacterized protein n=1 Tax=Stigmatella aurantiaca (strain DW4/3-1) TaxID=378806 RepID=E3FH47_STIAD|nr:uncharacterized protein STAUR_6320 [Stigmatella aurantiaca DW4/3-1]
MPSLDEGNTGLPTRSIDNEDASHRGILDARADGRAPADGRRRGLALPRALREARRPRVLPQGQSGCWLSSRGWESRGTSPAPQSSWRLATTGTVPDEAFASSVPGTPLRVLPAPFPHPVGAHPRAPWGGRSETWCSPRAREFPERNPSQKVTWTSNVPPMRDAAQPPRNTWSFPCL